MSENPYRLELNELHSQVRELKSLLHENSSSILNLRARVNTIETALDKLIIYKFELDDLISIDSQIQDLKTKVAVYYKYSNILIFASILAFGIITIIR